MTTETKTRPTHRIYAVTNQRIDYLPLNDAQLVIRVAGDEEAEGKEGAQ